MEEEYATFIHSDTWKDIVTWKHIDTWKLVPPPPTCNIIGYKWIFITKCNSDGIISKYKAIFVTKIYYQLEGLDFSKTIKHVIIPTIIRIILAIAISKN